MQLTRDAVHQILARRRAADPSLKHFGVQDHAYRLNPPLVEAEIVEVEKWLCVALPPDYRAFVTQVGDGGAGPGYGLLSLREQLAQTLSAGTKARRRSERLVEPADPARPFGRPVTIAEAAGMGGFPTHGVIPLCETGCGGTYCLVTAGTERGWVWGHDNVGSYYPAYSDDPVYPAGATVEDRIRVNQEFLAALLDPSNTVRLSFEAWYRRWLEGAAA